MNLFVSLAFLVVLTATTDLLDPCAVLQRHPRAKKYFDDETMEISICLDDRYCSHSALPLRISCVDAFTYLTLSNRRLITVPPIIGNERLSSQFFNINRIDQKKIFALLIDLIRSLTDRILDGLPRLVYVEDHDGVMLRRLVATARVFSLIVPNVPSNILDVPVLKKWKWSMRIISDYLTWTGMTFQETETVLISVVPFMHAFLSVAYYVPPIATGGELLSCIDYDILNTIVGYHPLYTDDPGETDGVWRIPSELHELPAYYPINFIRFLPAPDPEDLADLWGGPKFHDPEFPSFFVNILSNITQTVTNPDTMEKWKLVLMTLKYFGEIKKEYHLSEWFSEKLTEYFLKVVENFSCQWSVMDPHFCQLHQPQLRGLFILIRRRISELAALRLLLAYSNTMLCVPWRPSIRSYIHMMPTFEEKVVYFAGMDKYRLAADFSFYMVRQVANDDVERRRVRISLPDFFRALLVETFDPANGIFVPASFDDGGIRRFMLNRTVDQDDDFAPIIRRNRVFVGRLIALIIREGCGHFLKEYLPNYPLNNTSETSITVSDAIFFSSWYVRSGFYDVFHELMLERIFDNNGTLALSAIIFPPIA